jgi:hypothetical protein
VSVATGTGNTAVGAESLRFTNVGADNTGIGFQAGDANTFNSRNTFVGAHADLTSPTISDATAIGARAVVSFSNALVLGATAGLNGATSPTRVGIGTPNPAAMIEAVNDGVITDLGVFTGYGINPENAPRLTLRRARGSRATPADVIGADYLGQVGGGGYQGGVFSGARSFVRFSATSTWTAASQDAQIDFHTTPTGSVTPLQRMRIASDGDVGIGTITPLDRLQVVGDVRVGTGGANGCLRDFNGGTITGVCASDLRYKRDIAAFGPVLAQVAALKPATWHWNREAYPQLGFGSQRSYGLVAQDVEAVLPELVVTGADGYKAVDYSRLPLLAIQAIGELKRENDALRQQLEELSARVSAVEARPR